MVLLHQSVFSMVMSDILDDNSTVSMLLHVDILELFLSRQNRFFVKDFDVKNSNNVNGLACLPYKHHVTF